MPLLQRSVALVVLAIAACGLVAVGHPTGAAPGAGYRARAISIGDGDTLRVSTGTKLLTIRLACIDAPETAQSPYGLQSRAYLQQRLSRGRQLSILPHTTDCYERTVAEVISDIIINLVMVEDGQAFAYRCYLSSCNGKEYLDAEYRASRRRYGVWQVEGGITRSWDFRRGRAVAVIPGGTTPGGRRYRCSQIGSFARVQELLRQGHTYLDRNGDGVACESLRR
jgi:endonuclease YncB( thermonuclease family)